MKLWPFIIEKGLDDKPLIIVQHKEETRKFSPEEIQAMILGSLKEMAESYLKQKITKAVITVPSYFNDYQKQLTKDAAAIAGINVLRIINCSAAAGLALRLEKKFTLETYLFLFDFGGGTLNLSVILIEDDIYEIKATGGDNHLGGIDFDNKLIDYCCEQFQRESGIDIRTNPRALQRLRTQCERAKQTLSTAHQAIIEVDCLVSGRDFVLIITRTLFEEVCMNLFEKCISLVEKVLQDSMIQKSQIHEVELFGGSSRIPRIQYLLGKFFQGQPLRLSRNLEEANAYGAAIQSSILTGQNQFQDVLLLDVCPISLGIETAGGVMSVIIRKNTVIPVKKQQQFTTFADDQPGVMIQVFEGENAMTKDCNKLGKYYLEGIPPAKKGVPKINVQFLVDANGLLKITATEQQTEKVSNFTITNQTGRLTKEEIERLRKEEEKLKNEDLEYLKRTEVLISLESILHSVRISLKEIEHLNDEKKQQLQSTEKQISNWIEENPDANTNQYSEQFKLIYPIASEIFQTIEEKGILVDLENLKLRLFEEANQNQAKFNN